MSDDARDDYDDLLHDGDDDSPREEREKRKKMSEMEISEKVPLNSCSVYLFILLLLLFPFFRSWSVFIFCTAMRSTRR